MSSCIDSLREKYILKRTEIIVLIVNEKELDGFRLKLEKANVKEGKAIRINDTEVHPFIANGYHICYYLLPGKNGPAEAWKSFSIIADEFPNLKYIVNIGCCATVENKVENIVLVAERIFDADARKEEKDGPFYTRDSNRHYSSGNYLKEAVYSIKNETNLEYKVDYSGIISSSALIRNKEAKAKYTSAYPSGGGIEMEGTALSDYALSRNIEWLMIKGTSDNGINKRGRKGQDIAAYNATDVFLRLLSKETVLPKMRPSVFIGGAFSSISKKKCFEVEENSEFLGTELLNNNYKLITGLGLIVGTNVLASAYSFCNGPKNDNYEEFIETFPFPRTINKKKKERLMPLYVGNRQHMMKKSIISIFIYGRKYKSGRYNGLKDEFDYASSEKLLRFVIPTKKTCSNYLFELLKQNSFDGISGIIDNDYKNINTSTPFKDAVAMVLKNIDKIDHFFFSE